MWEAGAGRQWVRSDGFGWLDSPESLETPHVVLAPGLVDHSTTSFSDAWCMVLRLLLQWLICMFASSVAHLHVCFFGDSSACLLLRWLICMFASSVAHLHVCFFGGSSACLLLR
jgi:hypothetical protein